MVYVQERPSLDSIEFDDERVIMSHLFDGYSFKNPVKDVDYLNTTTLQDRCATDGMPEVSQVTRILLEHHRP